MAGSVLEARLGDEVRPGQAFAPMHWTGEEASAARIDSLVAPFTDPISGQPESKAARVRLSAVGPLWTGAAFSREPLRPAAVAWWAARGSRAGIS